MKYIIKFISTLNNFSLYISYFDFNFQDNCKQFFFNLFTNKYIYNFVNYIYIYISTHIFIFNLNNKQ